MVGAIKIQIFKGIGRLTQGDQRERINSTTPNGQYFIKRFWNTKKLEDYNFRVKNRYSNKKKKHLPTSHQHLYPDAKTVPSACYLFPQRINNP